MERKKFFQLFHLALILIDMTDAGKLCDFAAKFPCKGSHCLPSPCKSKTTQVPKEPTTAVTTEPQGTTLGKTMQESKEPTTTITTEPQGTTLGSSIYTCPPNMVYGNCTCEATCEDPKGESACNSTCLGSTGCICKAGLMLNGTDCISASRCSCFVTEANLVISMTTAVVLMLCVMSRMKYDSVIVMMDTKVTVKLASHCIQTVRMFMTLDIDKMAFIQSCLLDGLVYHSTYLAKWKTVEDGPCFNVVLMDSSFYQNWAAYKEGLVTAGTYG
ncbi:putative zonadhesin-like [Apostichopus japonicus]|uniref:Putative zonadhesin-like n=1 Tax=Stichopus japonicus TaxID=307972 RepID=A0A2G8LE23_STIJA|nr:putative zonadhesin-like [Apostichopus japonicus]